MKRALLYAAAILALIVVFGGSITFHFVKAHFVAKALANFRPPPVTVSATVAKEASWHSYIHAIGTLSAINGVNVSSEVAGKVTKIAFHSGDSVSHNQLLVQLDDSQERALLHQYEAQQVLAKINYSRALALRKRNLNSIQDLDNAREQLEVAKALVSQEKAAIAKKAITAPFSGVVGIRQINLGQYVTAGQTLVNLEQLNPLYVNFPLPQNNVAELHLGQTITADVNAFPKKSFVGKLTAVNPAVDPQSRTLQAQATIPNPDHLLRPGMFADIKVVSPSPHKVIVVPNTAIDYTLYGDSVYVLKKEARTKTSQRHRSGSPRAHKKPHESEQIYIAHQVLVSIEDQRGDLTAVTGIKPGDLVVTAGQIKLHNNTRVIINNSVNLQKLPVLTP